MRSATRLAGPISLITVYFAGLAALVVAIRTWWPALARHLPFGGTEALGEGPVGNLEIIETFSRLPTFGSFDALTLGLAIFGALLLMVPISWVYLITTRSKKVDRSFAQTMIVLPVIVAGIAAIVQNSLALAFSLAGIVAAVRFRFTLTEPAHALYVFVAIAVGLGAGISALGIAYVTTIAFVYTNLALWRSNYGSNLTTPFFAFLTGRGIDDNDL